MQGMIYKTCTNFNMQSNLKLDRKVRDRMIPVLEAHCEI